MPSMDFDGFLEPGTPGLAWQDDQSTLKLALEQAILKLESRVC